MQSAQMVKVLVRMVLVTIALISFLSPLRAQVQITSPASGALFSPGQVVQVTVAVSDAQILAVQVAGQNIGSTLYATSQPYSFDLTLPPDVVGTRNLFAVGLVANEEAIISPPVVIDVEPAAEPTTISVQQSLIAFGYVGEQQRISVSATFGDGSNLDISRSTRLTFASSNPAIVSVDATGMMTSVAPGNTTITVSFGNLNSSLTTVGPTAVKGDFNGDGLVTSEDLLLLESMLGSTPTFLNDARDLNGDGKIDDLDVQALLSVCKTSCPTLIATTNSLASSASQLRFTQPLTLTAKVEGSAARPPIGSVSFLVDGQQIDIGTLGPTGQTSIVSKSLSIGNHAVKALYVGDQSNAPSASQTLAVDILVVPGDANSDGVVNCLDLAIVKASFGKSAGQPGFDPRADFDGDGVVSGDDLSLVVSQLPPGINCPKDIRP